MPGLDLAVFDGLGQHGGQDRVAHRVHAPGDADEHEGQCRVRVSDEVEDHAEGDLGDEQHADEVHLLVAAGQHRDEQEGQRAEGADQAEATHQPGVRHVVGEEVDHHVVDHFHEELQEEDHQDHHHVLVRLDGLEHLLVGELLRLVGGGDALLGEQVAELHDHEARDHEDRHGDQIAHRRSVVLLELREHHRHDDAGHGDAGGHADVGDGH